MRVPATHRRHGETAQSLAARIAACDPHSETELSESIVAAIEDVEAQRDAFERAIAGMMATMLPGIGPENAGHYRVLPDIEAASAPLKVAVRRDEAGWMDVVVK